MCVCVLNILDWIEALKFTIRWTLFTESDPLFSNTAIFYSKIKSLNINLSNLNFLYFRLSFTIISRVDHT